MKIDWSKAPEGATHWEPESDGWNSSWMMLSGGGWHWWSSSSEDWMKCQSIKESRVSLMIPRPAAWTGEGLPPVGAKVILSDANHDVFEPYKEMIGVEVAVVASFASPAGFDMIACALPDGLCGCFRADMARPIRTPEQIAAEERERAIDDLCASIVSHYEAPKMSEHYLGLARALHDAGYRKQA